MKAINQKHITDLYKYITGTEEAPDENIMRYIYDSEARTIANRTNLDEIPESLEHIAEQRTVGELIRQAKGSLYETAQTPKRIQQGDVMFEFSGDNQIARLDSAVAWLTRPRDGEIICKRIIKW